MSHLQNPDEFYRKFSNDEFYRDLIHAMYGFAFLCFLWAAWGLYGCARSYDWKPAEAFYQQHPDKISSSWQVLCFVKEGKLIPVDRLYFGGNPPPLGFGPQLVPVPVTVYFNPDNPRDNVVYREPSWVTLLMIVTGFFLLHFIPKLKAAIAC